MVDTTRPAPAPTLGRLALLRRWAAFYLHCLIAVAVTLSLPLHRRWIDRLAGWWYRRLLRILGMTLEVNGTLGDSAALLVSNHVAWTDIIVYGALAQPAFISKAEVAKWPLVGAVARATQTVFLERGAFKTEDATTRIAARLAAGRSVMLFPEATTSAALVPRRFHARLFASVAGGTHRVQPLAIHYLPDDGDDTRHHRDAPWVGDAPLGGHLKALMRVPAMTVRVTVCPALDAEENSRSALAEHSRLAVARALTVREPLIESYTVAPASLRAAGKE